MLDAWQLKLRATPAASLLCQAEEVPPVPVLPVVLWKVFPPGCPYYPRPWCSLALVLVALVLVALLLAEIRKGKPKP